jgi:serine protease inhibitor
MRKPIVAIAAAAFLAMFAGCSIAAEEGADGHDQAANTASVDPVTLNRIAAAQAELGMSLLQRLAGEGSAPETLLVSPASLAMVFAFLDLGADAGMDRAIIKTLGFAPQDGPAAMQALRAAGKVLAAAPPAQGPLALANAIFVDPAGGVDEAALAKLQAAGMEARTAELCEPLGIAAVNDWVSRRTFGLIPEILTEPIPGASLVALNALHFKEKWLEAFDPNLTSDQPFHLVGGDIAKMPMMLRGAANLAFRQDDRFVAVALPYKAAGYSLVILTTKGGPAAVAEFAPVANWLTGIDFLESLVELSLPKFQTRMTADLLAHLDRLGLAEGRSPTAFKGFSAEPMDISDVVQKTVITVDEEGTEAAAATAVTATRALRSDTVKMVVDKPFIFALRDDRRGLILLVGYFGGPAGQ